MTNKRPARRIESLAAVSDGYDAIFCDVWGVVHDGLTKKRPAEAALAAAREAGLKVVLLTNAPRPAAAVAAQLDTFGFSRAAYDGIVTSGDATAALIGELDGPVFHIGPARDFDLFEGVSVERVAEADAEAVVATGLFDDEAESPADYAEMLARLAARGLPMVCANPDIVVHRGDRLIFCAGALARDYEALGGTVRLAGKPHRPIYDVASRLVGAVDRSRILAIGDGLMTDIAGANRFGIDVLLITEGIHGAELGGPDAASEAIAAMLAEKGLAANYLMADLQ
ncbi:TIGR01459 family HAD-type hydrolase [Aurantimonas sp. HBX-1]|uniref:TIGR01459 family HAD-type hydrolase n=1 Tax=Aurantimonas sp. HBX-1 TaxID=2906072 RepID=UPI001F47DDBB|nr:TIGR01459 family HAD-type hydrolase [Aurantimonas sp. HBX-1]UIJ71267.1 TIGR01459 family HAD-type hydrolase [Aurantimonas sp. HBX-1]